MIVYVRERVLGVSVHPTLQDASGDDEAISFGVRDEWLACGQKIFRRSIPTPRIEAALIDAREAGVESAQAGIEELFAE